MMDNTQDRPKPSSFGFGDDFSDLSKVKAKPAVRSTKKPAVKSLPKKSKSSPSPNKASILKSRDEASDKVAKSMGFASREAAKPVLLKKRRRTHHDEPVDQLSIRGPVRVLNDFIVYCEDNGVSYWEGLERLIDLKPSSSSKK